MRFNKTIYLKEMTAMVDAAFDKFSSEQPAFEIFIASVCTDSNAAASSISFDSKGNSDTKIEQSNAWNKKYYEQYLAEGNLEQAQLFEPEQGRNCNPAGFILRDYIECVNTSVSTNWEEKTKGKCWHTLEPLLKEIGQYAFAKIKQLKTHPDFELSVNGREDWYQFTWNDTPSVT